MKNFIATFLNFSPVFHVSCDERYGQYSDHCPIRLSLFVLVVGTTKIYFVTMSGKDFSFYKRLSFSSVFPPSTQAVVDQKTRDYANTAATQPPPAVAIHYEFLKEAFNNNATVKASLESKVSSYVSAYFVLIGFFAYLFNEIWKIPLGEQFYIAFTLYLAGTLFMVAFGFFIHSFLKVKGAVRSTFKELKASPTPHGQAIQAYTNWYASKEENRFLAGHVKNAESNMALSLVVAIPLWLFMLSYDADHTNFIYHGNMRATPSSEFEIIDSAGNLSQTSLDDLIDSLKLMSRSRSDKYYVISGTEKEDIRRDNIVNFVKLYVGAERVEEIRLNGKSKIEKSVLIKTKGL